MRRKKNTEKRNRTGSREKKPAQEKEFKHVRGPRVEGQEEGSAHWNSDGILILKLNGRLERICFPRDFFFPLLGKNVGGDGVIWVARMSLRDFKYIKVWE